MRARTSDELASARRIALERTAKWRAEAEKSVWPPPPKLIEEPFVSRHKKGDKKAIVAAAITLISCWAFLIGLGAGIGHKDFSESLLSNIWNMVFDLGLWGLAILYWVQVIRTQWQALKQEPALHKVTALYFSVALLVLLYGSGLYISLICLVARAAASNTIY